MKYLVDRNHFSLGVRDLLGEMRDGCENGFKLVPVGFEDVSARSVVACARG
jgi:hypothetical protein